MLEDKLKRKCEFYGDELGVASMDVIAASRFVVEQLLGERDRVGEFLPGIFDLNEALGVWDKLEDKHA